MASPKISCVLSLLCLVAPALGGAGDATVLVQSRLSDPATPGAEQAEEVPAAAEAAAVEVKLLLRLVFTRTAGNDHVCLNEITFEDEFEQPLTAEYESMSSCYGCATSCKGCAGEYGNTAALFDAKIETDDANWICSEHGGFVETDDGAGYGEEMITFTMARRPFKMGVHVKQAGTWSPKDWHVQEYLADRDTWSTMSKTKDAPEFSVNWATMHDGSLSLATNYPTGWQVCCQGTVDKDEAGVEKKVPIVMDFEPGKDAKLDLRLRAQEGRSLMNNGHGAQVEGDFGFLNYTNTLYSIRQVSWHVPSSFQLPNGDMAAGEMHITCVSLDKKIIVINLLLQLPKEEQSLDSEAESLFLQLGLASIPEEGSPRDLATSFDISSFETYFADGFVHFPCEARPDVTWFILAKPAMVSGVIIQAFKTYFPNPLAFWDEDADLDANGNPNDPQRVRDWNDFRLGAAAQKEAYRVGDFGRGPKILWEDGVAKWAGEPAAPSNNTTGNASIDEEPVIMGNAIIDEGLGA